MPRFAHLGLAVLGAALTVPASTRAGDDPPAASPSPAANAFMPTDHKHFGRVARGLVPCEKCLARARAAKSGQPADAMVQPAEAAAAPHHRGIGLLPRGHARHDHGPIPTAGMPEGSRIVGCAHSSNGVCASCKALLEMPGEVVTVAPGMPATAIASASPGRAVATDAAPGRAVAAAGEPEPIGVMRTNYAEAAPAGARPAAPAQPAMPAEPGRGPFLGQQHETKPRVLSHLFGFSAWERDIQDKMGEKERRKREKHAAISYDSAAGKVEELPASMVFGRGAPR